MYVITTHKHSKLDPKYMPACYYKLNVQGRLSCLVLFGNLRVTSCQYLTSPIIISLNMAYLVSVQTVRPHLHFQLGLKSSLILVVLYFPDIPPKVNGLVTLSRKYHLVTL